MTVSVSTVLTFRTTINTRGVKDNFLKRKKWWLSQRASKRKRRVWSTNRKSLQSRPNPLSPRLLKKPLSWQHHSGLLLLLQSKMNSKYALRRKSKSTCSSRLKCPKPKLNTSLSQLRKKRS